MSKKIKGGYHHLTKDERNEIEILLKKEYGVREISEAIDKNPATISREIQRNKKRKTENYDSAFANHKAYTRRKYSQYQGKEINENKELKRYITERLQEYWSPDDISGRMILENQPFYASKNSIYRWLNTNRSCGLSKYLYSHKNWPHGRKKYRRGHIKRELIPNRIGIEKRPKRYLREFGHWEADTAVSGKRTKSKVALSVAGERQSMFLRIKKLNSLKPEEFINSLKKIEMKSAAMDNGIENRDHEKLNIETYFCDPYSPWQKGKIESLIRMVRRFVKKKSDIGQYSDEYIKMVERLLNHKPRKSLGYFTPYERFLNYSLDKKKLKKHQLKGGVALRG